MDKEANDIKDGNESIKRQDTLNSTRQCSTTERYRPNVSLQKQTKVSVISHDSDGVREDERSRGMQS